MFSISRSGFAVAAFVLLSSGVAQACDFCSLFSSLEQRQPKGDSFHIGLTEQFSEAGKLQDNGAKVANEMHQRLVSSQTFISAGYDFTDRLSLDLTLPYINRRFTRVEGESVAHGTEAGIGDITTSIGYLPYRSVEGAEIRILKLSAGVKLPTGDSDRLAEELSEEHMHENALLRHGDEEHEMLSAVHGHDLALGSGSFDFPLGAAGLWQSGRAIFESEAEYVLRTPGDHSYRYANDLRWRVSPGYYAMMNHSSALALKVNLGGEYKPMDKGQGGEKQGDTSINTLWWGPEVSYTSSGALGVFAAYDIPLNIENSGVQAVMSYRLRVGMNYRF